MFRSGTDIPVSAAIYIDALATTLGENSVDARSHRACLEFAKDKAKQNPGKIYYVAKVTETVMFPQAVFRIEEF